MFGKYLCLLHAPRVAHILSVCGGNVLGNLVGAIVCGQPLGVEASGEKLRIFDGDMFGRQRSFKGNVKIFAWYLVWDDQLLPIPLTIQRVMNFALFGEEQLSRILSTNKHVFDVPYTGGIVIMFQ